MSHSIHCAGYRGPGNAVVIARGRVSLLRLHSHWYAYLVTIIGGCLRQSIKHLIGLELSTSSDQNVGEL